MERKWKRMLLELAVSRSRLDRDIGLPWLQQHLEIGNVLSPLPLHSQACINSGRQVVTTPRFFLFDVSILAIADGSFTFPQAHQQRRKKFSTSV
jgi:hypothetical protein